MRKFIRAVLIFVLSICVSLLLLYQACVRIPIIKQNIHYVLKSGTNVSQLLQQISAQSDSVLANPNLLKLILKIRGDGNKLQAGEYCFTKHSSIKSILDKLSNGDVIYHRFTVIEGWTFKKILQQLHNTPNLKRTLVSSSALAKFKQELGVKYKNFEGLLYPETYSYVLGASDADIIEQAYQKMRCFLQLEWQKRSGGLWYKNSYQVLIVASMIEKETSTVSEKPMIAAIILKRLQIWMPLQIDPAVIYGLSGKFKGKLSSKDLKHKTAYNTYVNYGLPPTPISMPSKSSILAALHPATTDALYFVARGDGTHEFSKTLKTHDKAVRKYILKQSGS
jgi:UPF0755 protein